MNFKRYFFATLAVLFGLYTVAPTVAAVKDWSTTPSANATADAANGINFSEGQSPGSLNDSMRALMAVIKGDFDKSHANPGYQKFPNGLIIQWGSASSAFNEFQITYPIPFPTAALAVSATVHGTVSSSTVMVAQPTSATTSNFVAQVRQITSGAVSGVSGQTVSWIAIGY